MTVKIIVADQMDLALEGIEKVLSQHQDFQVIGTCQTLDDLLARLTEQRPDVLLIGDRLELGLDVLSLVSLNMRQCARRDRMDVC